MHRHTRVTYTSTFMHGRLLHNQKIQKSPKRTAILNCDPIKPTHS